MKEITGFVILLVSLAAGGPAQCPLPRPGPARPSLSPMGTPLPLPLAMDLGPPLFPGSPDANGLGWRHWAAVGMKNHCLGLPPQNLSQRPPMEGCELSAALTAPHRAAHHLLPLFGGSNSRFMAFIT